MQWTDEMRREAARMYHADEDITWDDVGEAYGVSGLAARKAVSRLDEEVEDDKVEQTKAAYAYLNRMMDRFPDWELPEEIDWRQWFDTWGRINEMHKTIDPTQEMLTVDLSHADGPVAVAFAADLHMGGGYTDHQAIKDTISYILDTPNLLVAFVGDGIEGFIPGDKSAETSEQMPSSLKAQLAAYNALVQELAEAEKLLFCTWGDHDAKWFEKYIGINVMKQQIHDVVPYFTGRGLVTLKVGEQEYYTCVNHSERFNSQWNKNHPQRRQYERFFPADVNVSGHKHKPAFQMDTHYEQLRQAGLNVGGKHWLVATGTYKTGPDPYTIRSYTRGVLGVPTVVFHDDIHDTDCFESPAKAVAYIRGLDSA